MALLDALAARLFEEASHAPWTVALARVVDRDMVTVVATVAALAVAGLSPTRRNGARPDPSPSATDLVAVTATALLILVPHASAGWLALGVLGAYGIGAWRTTAGPHAAAAILAAVGLYEVGGRLVVGLASPLLTQIDAAAAAGVLSLIGAPAVLTRNLIETSAGHDLVIVNSCLSLRPILQAWLVFFTATRIARPQPWHSAELAWLVGLAAVVFALNTARIVLYGMNVAIYHALHDGALAPLFGLIVLALALAAATWSVRHEVCASRLRR